jgi:cytochrome c553
MVARRPSWLPVFAVLTLAVSTAAASTPIIEDPFEPISRGKRPGQPSSTPAAYPDDSAQEIWAASCAMCHAKNGSAKTYMGRRDKVRNLADPLWQESVTDAQVAEVIRNGVADTKMRGFEKKMTRAQLEQVVRWVRTLASATR